MSITVTIDPAALRQLNQNMQQVAQTIRRRMETNLKGAVLIPENEVKRLMSNPGTGSLYRRGRTTRTGRRTGRRGRRTVQIRLLNGSLRTFSGRLKDHRASRPRRPPAVDTGALRASVSHDEPQWHGPDDVSIGFGSNMPQARRLEYGGRDSRGVMILARPVWRTVMNNPSIQQKITDRVQRNLT